MAKDSKKVHQKIASFGGMILVLSLLVGAIWFGYSIWSKNQPEKPRQTQQQIAMQQQKQKAAQPRKEVFTIYPGQGKVLVTNYGKVGWKTTGPAMVRERDQAWFGQWKEDLPGRETRFSEQDAHAIEFWVPRNFPGPVTIKIEIIPPRV